MNEIQPVLGQTLDNFSEGITGAALWIDGNWPTLLVWVIWIAAAVTAAFALYVLLTRARNTVVSRLGGAGNVAPWRQVLASVVDSTSRLFFVALAAALAAAILGLASSWLTAIVGAILIIQFGLWAGAFLREALARYAETRAGDRGTIANALSLMKVLINVAVWSVVALVLLSNLGIDVTALVAGLGIGGIAIGLAAQGIFADLFASLSIILDRPFVRGDFVIFGDHMGTIERIGIKSTRIRSLSGEQIVVSNANLLQTTIRNYQLLYERRVVFTLDVSYRTPVEVVQEIPALLEGAVRAARSTRFDRAHFKGFGASALTFEVAFYVLSSDYNVYMDVQQHINLTIMRGFAERDIEFAFPTRTVFFHDGDVHRTTRHHGSGTEGRQVVRSTDRAPVELLQGQPE